MNYSNLETNSPKQCSFMSWVFIALAMVATGVTTYFVTESVHSNGNIFRNNIRFTPAASYETSILFHIPYLNFTEPVVINVKEGKSMRLSYYGGMDTYLLNAESTSFQIVPIIDKQTCLKTGEAGEMSLVDPFPSLDLFKKVDNQVHSIKTSAFPNGVDVILWEYRIGKDIDSSGNSTFAPPDEEGYVGVYKFYVHASTGKPIRHHMIGHNINLGGSHFDEYIVDYLSYIPTTSVEQAENLFTPPPKMKCIDFSDIVSGGPVHKTKGRTFRNPLHDIVSHFPRGYAQVTDDFSKFALKYKPEGYADITEHNFRHSIFNQNMRYINAANRQGRSYTLAVNHLADWTADERTVLLGRLSDSNSGPALKSVADQSAGSDSILGDVPDQICGQHTLTGKTIPASVDWRKDPRGVVLPPKDQGTCGSCWTYGITGTIEGQVALKTGKVSPSLSEQNLLDCSWGYGNMACDGGLDYMGVTWMIQHNEGRIATSDSYGGYLNQDGFCHYDAKLSLIDETVEEGAKVKSCTHITDKWNGGNPSVEQSAKEFNDALANIGPISVAIDATPEDFYFYSSGIYYNTKCGNGVDDLDHIVLAVGYETLESGEVYSIIRNSWSDLWGEGGYMRISQKDNVCGVMTTPMYVTLDD